LSLIGNDITGSIPPEIGNLTNLTVLKLYSNQLTGSIPSEIVNLTNLTELNLKYNQLTGSIPPEIWNLTNLERLYLGSNQLTGSIPPEIWNLTNLERLYLFSNQLTGSIPSEIGSLTNLTGLYLFNNQLTDSIPSEIGNLTNLTYLDLNGNQLTGEVPESICDLNVNWSDSWSFNISNNQLCPPYPSCIEGFVATQDTSGCPSVVCETYYNENVAPILSSNCIGCHSGSSASAGLYLDSYTSVYSAIKSGNVLDRVNRNNGDNGFMPQGGQKLSNANLDILQTFFDMDCNE
jgi:hypothetical protein